MKCQISNCLNAYAYIFPSKAMAITYGCRVIDMGHIDISITLLKQYSSLSLVNTYRNVAKYQKHYNGHLKKKFRAEYCWRC